METLEAEVRSKFQTDRRISETSQGVLVEVPFDETMVKYLWVSERVFDIVDIEMRAKNKTVLIENEILASIGAPPSVLVAAGDEGKEDVNEGLVSNNNAADAAEDREENAEVEEGEVIEENAF